MTVRVGVFAVCCVVHGGYAGHRRWTVGARVLLFVLPNVSVLMDWQARWRWTDS